VGALKTRLPKIGKRVTSGEVLVMPEQSHETAPPDWWTRPLFGNKAATLILLVALIAAGVWYYSGTATVYLENHSTGRSIFYVDDNRACDAQPETQCTVRLYVWKTHTLRAYTYYGDKSPYQTAPVSFQVQRDEVYRYVSCGMTGAPGANCGIFSVRIHPPTY